MEIKSLRTILNWAKELDGVFTTRDLQIAFSDKSNPSVYRLLQKLLSAGELIRVKRGVYAIPTATLPVISNRIHPDSYISTGTVLAKKTIIGSVPARKLQVIKTGSPRVYQFKLGTIEFLSIAPKLFFGFERINSCNWATPEKAFLDVCYFYYKRKKFSFDLDTDINFDLLDFSLVEKYLKNYDLRFVTYFNKRWP